jgi:hypothetical protein
MRKHRNNSKKLCVSTLITSLPICCSGECTLFSRKPQTAFRFFKKPDTLRPDAIDPHRILADAYAQLGEEESSSRERAEAERIQAAGGSRLGTSAQGSEEKP